MEISRRDCLHITAVLGLGAVVGEAGGLSHKDICKFKDMSNVNILDYDCGCPAKNMRKW